MIDYAKIVAAGIKFLDDKVATGEVDAKWREKLDLDKLDLGSCEVCVLGQLFGSYDNGVASLDLGYDLTKKYGFNTGDDFRQLTAAWKDALGKNNVLVERGDIYKSKYSNSAVKIESTQVVMLDGGEVITTYIALSGTYLNNTFTESRDGSGQAVYSVWQKSAFEKDGIYPKKVVPFTLKKGMFFELKDGRIFFAYNSTDVREVKEGSDLMVVQALDLQGAKEIKTKNGMPFGENISGYLK